MLLAVDVGNTHTVVGIYEDDRLVHDFRLETAKGRTADEYHVLFLSLMQLADLHAHDIRQAIVASVVPPLTHALVDAIDGAFDIPALVVGPGIRTGMPILYDNPREVGADRVVNAVAAFEQVGDAVIVVDFGTATTFDCVSPRGEYLGGAIAPGIQISANALFSNAAKLPRIEISRPSKALGRNTVDSMRAGIAYGYAGLVDGLVQRLQEEMGGSREVVATGGLAPLIAFESKTIGRVDEMLTLEGLRIIHHRNAS